MYLADCCPDPKGGRGIPWDRFGGGVVEDGDRNNEFLPFCGNAVPQNPPQLPHRQSHRYRLPQSQSDLEADGDEVGSPL